MTRQCYDPAGAAPMSDPDRVVSADVAGLAAAIERAAADLAVAEEPAGFVVALEGESDLGERGD